MSKSCFFFLRLPDRTPVGCVALRLVEFEGGKDVLVAASLCHKSDEWVRKHAVNKACGRLNSTEQCAFVSAYGDDDGVLDVLVDILYDLNIDVHRRGVDMDHARSLFDKQVEYLLNPKGE